MAEDSEYVLELLREGTVHTLPWQSARRSDAVANGHSSEISFLPESISESRLWGEGEAGCGATFHLNLPAAIQNQAS